MKEMKKTKKKEIIDSYNSESYNEIYDRRYKSIQFEKFEPFYNSVNEDPLFLLDYGCGTGLLWDFYNLKNRNDVYNENLM